MSLWSFFGKGDFLRSCLAQARSAMNVPGGWVFLWGCPARVDWFRLDSGFPLVGSISDLFMDPERPPKFSITMAGLSARVPSLCKSPSWRLITDLSPNQTLEMATMRHLSHALKIADYILFSLTSWRNMRWVQINCARAWQPLNIQTMCRHVSTRFNAKNSLSCTLLTVPTLDTAKPSIMKVVLLGHSARSKQC